MTTITFGDDNSGFKEGTIRGPVSAPGPERPETPLKPSILIPFSRDRDFVERRKVFDQIQSHHGRPGAWTALVGLGGVGKSQVAIEYAYRVQERFSDTWAFWIHASNRARFEQGFRDLATFVKIPGRQNPEANIFQLVHDWLRAESKGPWIIVLDNVDDPSFLKLPDPDVDAAAPTIQSADARELISYIPNCRHGSVLVTSRSRGAALQLVEYADIIAIEPMGEAEALRLFQNKLGQSDDEACTVELAAALEYLPLAIVQAAAYILQRRPGYSLRRYLEEFRSDRRKVDLLRPQGGKLRRDAEAKNSILITWQISFDYIRVTTPSASEMLSLMSFCYRQGIPKILLRGHNGYTRGDGEQNRRRGTSDLGAGDKHNIDADNDKSTGGGGGNSNGSDSNSTEQQSDYSDNDRFESDIVTLRNFSFIIANNNGTTFDMHRLVQLATLEWLRAQDMYEYWRHQFLVRLCAELPVGEYENWSKCQALFPHAQSVSAQRPAAMESLKVWATILYKAAWYALRKGKGIESENLSVQAMKARKRIFNSEHEDVIWSKAMVASAYSLRGRWNEAERLEVQVMETRKTKLGPDHPDTLTSMGNLASTYREQGRLEEAERLEVQVMETRKTKLGPDHPDTLTSMGNLASTYREQGRLEEAESIFVQVLKKFKTKLGPNHPSMLSSMANLASTYRNQGRWEEAENLTVQTMETRKIQLGSKHPDTLDSITNLVSMYKGLGRWEAAEKLEMQVMKFPAEKHEQSEQTPTDSGYASGTHRASMANASAVKDLEMITEGPEHVHERPAIAVAQPSVEEQEVQSLGLNTAQTMYSASETSTLPPPEDKTYMSDLAAELFGTIRLCDPNRETLDRITEMLPDLLKAFALKLACRAENPMHRDASFFVHKHRRRIRDFFESMFPLDDDDPDITSLNAERARLRQSAIDRFLEEPDADIHERTADGKNGYHDDSQGSAPHEDMHALPVFRALEENSEDFDAANEPVPDASPYRDFIVKTPAYTWLVTSLKREMALTRANPDLMDVIRKEILRALPSHKISRRVPSQEYKVIFELDWNALAFVEEQYIKDPDEALKGAITVTGSANEAQTVTAWEYLSQAWPAMGKHAMQLIIDVIRDTADHHVTSLPDGSELGAQIDGSKFIVTTVGTRDSVAEVGQLFAWLGAALRSSTLEIGVATCVPCVRKIRLRKTDSPHDFHEALEPMSFPELSCVINFEITEPVSHEGLTEQNWYNIFRNPVMVSGYPVPAEHERRGDVHLLHASSFWTTSNLAEVLRRQGKYEEAEQMHRPALEMMERALGKEHPYTLVSMSNFANVLKSQRKYKAAEEAHQQTLKLRERMLDKERLHALPNMGNPALLSDAPLNSGLLNFVYSLPVTAKGDRLDDLERLLADATKVNDPAVTNDSQSALHAAASYSFLGAASNPLTDPTEEGDFSLLESDNGSMLTPRLLNHSTSEQSLVMETHTPSLWVSWIDGLWYMSMWILDPPCKNTKRIVYTCGCGDRRYLDVQSPSPGDAEELQNEIRAEAMAVRRRGLGNSSQPTLPPVAHLPAPNQPRDQVSEARVSSSSSSIALRGTGSNIADFSRNQPPSNAPAVQKFLLICVNTKRGFIKHQHIDISSITNDQYLFQEIFKEYSGLRCGQEFNLGRLFPGPVRVPRWISAPFSHIHLPKWLLHFKDCNIFVPRTAEFVQFQLMTAQTEIVAGNLVKPELPGEEEVIRKRTYEYHPFPPRKIVRIPFIHELLKPGEHLGCFWWKRFPKKLNEILTWDENLDCVGWGIYINEGWNARLVGLVVFLLMIIFALFVVMYSAISRDGSTGAGVGSFVIAFLTLGCWLRYEGWKTEMGQNG